MNKVILLSIMILLFLTGCGQSNYGTEQLIENNYNETQTITLNDYDIAYTGNGISVAENTVTISKGGNYVVSGTLSDGNIAIDTKETVFLVLKGVDITSARSSAIAFINDGEASIEIAEGTENYLSDEDGKAGKVKKSDTDGDKNAVLYSNSTIELHGSGILHITGNNRGGVHSSKEISIFSGTYIISAKNQGIFAQNKLFVNGGEINVNQSKEGMECKGNLIINAGTMRIFSKDDALNAGTNLIVNGGYLYAECDGDGFDSNGNMTINGGEIYIFAGNEKNSALDVSDGEKIGKFTVNGGTIIAAGGNMKIAVENVSKQNHTWIYASHEGAVNVDSESGDRIAEFTFPKRCDLLFVSTEKINSNDEYIISVPTK